MDQVGNAEVGPLLEPRDFEQGTVKEKVHCVGCITNYELVLTDSVKGLNWENQAIEEVNETLSCYPMLVEGKHKNRSKCPNFGRETFYNHSTEDVQQWWTKEPFQSSMQTAGI